MKVAVLGGSSAGTPELFRCLGSISELPPLEIWLVGRCSEHLLAVSRAARLLLGDAPVVLHSCSFAPHELRAALDGADVVLVQIRVGGHDGRHFDETFPVIYGLCGDEGLGPGGLSAGWRGWPTVRRLLETVSSVCPNAFVLMLSAPLGILVGAAQREFPSLEVVGICELPWTTLLHIAESQEVDVREIDFDYIGLNHLGWFYRIQTGTRDLLLEYSSGPRSLLCWPPPKMVADCRAYPTKYQRLHYYSAEIIAEQKRQARSRAQELEFISNKCYQAFACGNEATIIQALEQRSMPWYEHAVVPLLVSLAGRGESGPYFLTGRTNAQFGFQGMWEVPVSIVDRRFCLHPPRSGPPEGLVEMFRAFVTYETQAISAVTSQDPAQVGQALAVHPWVATEEVADLLAKTITSQSTTVGA